ncbi:hypothetical protein ACQEVB_37920 [Pseudonocardia sp. CA-107938]|uniref:hypothetical protein n=1 Tax=Pseudonocardia sp. CA-107938 TaxID=3240021 RepID=UPI003D8D9979
MTTTQTVPRPAATRGRTIGIVIGVAVLLASVAVGVFLGARHRAVTTTSFDGVREIVLDVDQGSVALARAPGATSEVTVSREWRSAEPRTSAAVVDGVLRISARCMDGSCATAYDVTVPAGATVRLGVGAGSVQAVGLDVHGFAAGIGTGSVSATFAVPPDRVAMRAGVGSLLVGVPPADYDVDARATAGMADVRVVDVPGAARTLRVEAGSGTVQVAVAG